MANEERDFDIIVIGGGFGGVTAALRAAELGLRTVLLEKGTGDSYPCNSRYSGGIVHVSFKDIRRTPSELIQAVNATTGGEANPVQTRALAENVGRWVDWLQQHGARFMRFNMEEGYRWCMAPPRAMVPGPDWKNRGPDVLLRHLVKQFEAAGGKMRRGTKARELVMEKDACAGVVAEADGQKTTLGAHAVVIADGGFQAHRESFEEHIGPNFDAVFQRGAASGMGDGIRMAKKTGAHMTDCKPFYGHLLARGVEENDKLWPYPELDAFATAGVIVGQDGLRFLDEGRGGIAVANDLARLPDPGCGIAIFDANIWNGPGRAHRIPANPLLEKAGATLHRADTLGELAAQLGLPADALEQTIDSHNAAVAAEATDRLDPPRSARVPAYEIRFPPFMAIRITPGITYTMGGIEVDGAGRVLSNDGTPIRGLYAAGASTGGIEGGSHNAYVGGIAKAGTFGMLAAEDAASQISGAGSGSDTAEVAKQSRFPILGLVVLYGRPTAGILGMTAGTGLAALLWGSAGWWSLLAALVAGGAIYFLVRLVTELVTLITEMLLPQ